MGAGGGWGEEAGRVADKRLALSEGRAFGARGKELQMSACSVMHHCFIQSLKQKQRSSRALAGGAVYYR